MCINPLPKVRTILVGQVWSEKLDLRALVDSWPACTFLKFAIHSIEPNQLESIP